MSSIVPEVVIPTPTPTFTPRTIPPAPLRNPRLTKLAAPDLHALAVGSGFGQRVRDAKLLGEVGARAVCCGHGGSLAEFGHAEGLEGGGSGSSGFV